MITKLAYDVLHNSAYKQKWIACKGRKLKVEVADSFMKKMVGLMYREKMGSVDGMLFHISQPGILASTITMANMKFSIDILWLDREKRVVDIAENAKPSVSMFDSYKPKAAAAYVIELKSGMVRKLGIKLHDRVFFS